jgi:hypothetical protein
LNVLVDEIADDAGPPYPHPIDSLESGSGCGIGWKKVKTSMRS